MSRVHPAVAGSGLAATRSRLESLITRLTTSLPRQYAATLLNDAKPLLIPSADERHLEETLLHVALANQRDDPEYGAVARDLLLRRIYRDALASPTPTLQAYRAAFATYLEQGVEQGLLDVRLLAFAEAAAWLEPERDRSIKYLGLATLADRYLIKEVESAQLIETPQFLFMRVALGTALAEGEPLEWAVRFYERMSTLRYLPGTPTLFNAGTPHHQLSSCYVYDIHDDLTHILETTRDFGLLAKYAGGVGTSVAKLRAMGSPVRGVSGRSSGLIPFINMYDALFKAIDQGGRRRGTLAVYLEPWHLELSEFLDLRRNSGDHYRRAHSIDTVLWISDEFMRRVEADEAWTLFDPAVAEDLTELYGDVFAERYGELERRAQEGALPERSFRVVRARETMNQILAALQETSHPWITFKDAFNARSPNKQVGVIHSSNLCTEIGLPTDKDHIAVCNLASINLAKHVTDGELDWRELEISVRLAVRQLDNVIDVNFYPSDKAARSNHYIRPVGLGVMGFAEFTQTLGVAYGSAKARQLTSDVFAFMNYHATDESANLAQEKGSYPAFEGSTWSHGQLTADTLADADDERGFVAKAECSSLPLDWPALREKVERGMRNSVVSAVAPTATIGLIAGTSPSLDPYFANVFARNTLSGKFLEFNPGLVRDLKTRGLWDEVKDQLIAERGDLTFLNVPQELKDLYQTAFRIEPDAYLDIAARAQVYVDQGISRNMYLTTRNVGEMREVYLSAWKRGLKSTYYLFMQPRMSAEQSTVAVNKTKKKPKWVGLLHQPAEPASLSEADTCSLDEGCDSCQ